MSKSYAVGSLVQYNGKPWKIVGYKHIDNVAYLRIERTQQYRLVPVAKAGELLRQVA